MANNDFKEQGSSGTAIFGGFIVTNDNDPRVTGQNRYKTAADILANISVVAASVRFFLNLVAKPKWSLEPADESPEAEAMAEFVQSVIEDLDSSWTRIIRRSALYRFHGFGLAEWTAVKRDDGRIGFIDIEARPQHTIERWNTDDAGRVESVVQRSPQTGEQLEIERRRLIYYVDDSLTDSPEGMGWFRHLVEPAARLKHFLKLEKIGYERDLSGVPVGKAPLTDINKAVKNGDLDQAKANDMINGMRDFVQIKMKESGTGIMFDSKTYQSQTSDGKQPSSVPMWELDLLTSDPGSMQQLLETIKRLNTEMALIIGTENILTGTGDVGSMALSKDKSNNLYLNVSSTLEEMVEINNRDFIGALWDKNGFDPKLKPKFKTEDVSFKDVEMVAGVLRDLASAGGILGPDDPAIDDVRDLIGVSRSEPAQ